MMKQGVHQFWIASGIALCCLAATSPAQAQIASDGTVSTNVKTTNNLNFTITDGSRAGKNLFHSFSEFSVPTRGSAFFNNAADIQNIITRVTGSSVSKIDGLIRANGTANLFLLNPNGIIFGHNASLKIGGSFLASTASSLNFSDGTQFSATASQTKPLLTVNVPIGLQFGGSTASILNQSQATNSSSQRVGLQVQPGKTLALVGGDVALAGGRLTATGGRIELGSVAGIGIVSLNPADKGWALGYEGVQDFKDIQLSQQALVNASGSGGGDIQVQGGRITLTDKSSISANTLGSQNGGGVSIRALQLNIGGGARVSANTIGSGKGGDVTLETGQLSVGDGAQITADTNGEGSGGNLAVTASDAVKLSGTSADGTASRLSTETQGAGAAGNVTIATGKLSVRDGAQVAARTYRAGSGGNLTVTASDSVELSGTSAKGKPSGLFASTEGTGTAGNVTIATGKLSVHDGGKVADNTFSEGRGGNLSVTASDSVELMGGGSSLFTRTEGTGAAGDLTLATRQLSVRDGAVVSAGTSPDSGVKGGNLTVTAPDSVELMGEGSGLFTQTEGAGDAGDLTVVTGQLRVWDGAVVSASTLGQGKGGELRVNASNSVNLSGVDPSGFSSGLFTSTSGGGQGGNITVDTNALQMTDGAVVSARTTAAGNGGNITVNANTFDAVRGGQILTTTGSSGRAGNISLNVPNNVTLSGSDPTFTDRLARLGRNVVNNEGAASGIFASTALDSTGNGGSISIDPIKLTLTDGAGVAVGSLGKGNAGNLRIQAGLVTLDRGAFLSAATSSGEGGNITLKAQDLLLMRHNSQISAEAFGTANGGNITINTPFIVAVPAEESDIIANAFKGRGGNIGITARGIFGIQPRNWDTSQSYISASSQLGINGTVQINTLDINPSLGLVNLPVQPVDVTGLIAQGCPADVGPRASKFVVTGRGGLPPTPREALRSDPPLVDLGTTVQGQENHASAATSTNPTSSEPAQIVEATGWVTNAKGEVVLIAQPPTVTPDIPWLTPTTCHAP